MPYHPDNPQSLMGDVGEQNPYAPPQQTNPWATPIAPQQPQQLQEFPQNFLRYRGPQRMRRDTGYNVNVPKEMKGKRMRRDKGYMPYNNYNQFSTGQSLMPEWRGTMVDPTPETGLGTIEQPAQERGWTRGRDAARWGSKGSLGSVLGSLGVAPNTNNDGV